MVSTQQNIFFRAAGDNKYVWIATRTFCFFDQVAKQNRLDRANNPQQPMI